MKDKQRLSFLQALTIKEAMEAECERCSAILQDFPRTENGLTPDSVRATTEWREAKRAFDCIFAKLRRFNSVFVREYK